MSSPGASSTSDWEPPLPDELQRMLPNYEVTGILGRGGMGAVYKGIQRNLERPVAIKLLPETFSKGADELNFTARFKQEARAMAKMAHPAIISVYDFGETENGQLYFVMEFIDGMDIHQYMKAHGGKLPQEHALNIVAHVLDALEYAHHQGIVHRDIKPANILINREGRVKIADFGLAKKFGAASDQSQPALTMSNMAVGTPDFVAPESLESGRTVDHRADLYAVGVMLYQLLTGRLPRGQFKSPSEAVPGLDPRLDAIVSRAMQAEPEDRYPSAAAVRADLDVIFSRPMARVEAGAETEAIPVAVPVTTSVKDGAIAAKAGPGSAKRTPSPGATKPRAGSVADRKAAEKAEVPEKSKGPLVLGLSAAAAVVVGLAVYWLNRGPDPQPVASKAGKSSAPSGSTVSAPAAENPSRMPEPRGENGEMKAKVPPKVISAAPETPITPKKTPAAETAAFPPGKWVKVEFNMVEIAGAGASLNDDGALRMGGRAVRLPQVFGSNLAIRAKVKRPAETQYTGISLRNNERANRQISFGPNVVKLRATNDNVSIQDGTSISHDLDFGVTEPVQLEVATIGDLLFGRVNGRLIDRIKTEKAAMAGTAMVFCGSNVGYFSDVEVMLLDGLPEAEALKLVGVDERGKDLRQLAGDHVAAAESAAAIKFPPGKRVKIFTEVADLPQELRTPDGGVTLQDGWWHFAKANSPLYTHSASQTRHAILRLRTRWSDENVPLTRIQLRSKKLGPGLTETIRLHLQSGGRYVLGRERVVDGKSALDTLREGALNPAPKNGEEIEMELGVIGKIVFGRVNSQFVSSEYPVLNPGPIAYVYGQLPVTGIEVINLDGLPEAEALKLAGVDDKGRDLRPLLAAEAAKQAEQAKAADALAAVPELKALHEQFLGLEAERVTKVFAADFATLNTGYLGGIDRAIADAKKAGSLDTVLALEQEKARIAANEGVPVENEATAPESLKKLRVIYRDSLAKLEAARAANRKTLTDPLIVRLKQMEIDLTKQDRVAHAKTVREYREKVEAAPESAAAPASPVPAAAGTAGPPAPRAPELVSDRVRPDPKKSRAAAEYALSIGSGLELLVKGAKVTVAPGGTLPASDFEVWRVNFPGSKGLTITNADLQAITEARELRIFSTGDQNKSEISTLTPFQKTPLIEEINCYHFGALTERECAIVASLPNLKRFNVLGRGDPIENLPLLLSAPLLENLSFSGGRLRPEDGAVLNRFPKLRRLTISAADMDAILSRMGDMDQVEVLAMSHTTVSEAGLGALNGKLSDTLRELAFGKPADDSSSVAAFAFRRFPKLKTVGFRGELTAESFAGLKNLAEVEDVFFTNATLTSAHFDTLSQCKSLTEITFGVGNLTTADLAALRRLRSLKRLTIKDNGIRIEPAVIPEFGKLDTLTTLELPESQVTEAQVTELKKALPTCAISRVKAYQ